MPGEVVYSHTQLVGIGETYAGYFCPEIVPETVEFFKPILVGQNVDRSVKLTLPPLLQFSRAAKHRTSPAPAADRRSRCR